MGKRKEIFIQNQNGETPPSSENYESIIQNIMEDSTKPLYTDFTKLKYAEHDVQSVLEKQLQKTDLSDKVRSEIIRKIISELNRVYNEKIS